MIRRLAKKIKLFFFPPFHSEMGAWVMVPIRNLDEMLPDFESMFLRQIEDVAIKLATARSWPIDRRRHLSPGSLKVIVKTPSVSSDPINFVSTIAWKIDTFRWPKRPRQIYVTRKLVDDMPFLRAQLSKAFLTLIENRTTLSTGSETPGRPTDYDA